MKSVTVSIPQLLLIVGTRAAAAAGVALLMGKRLTPEQRSAVGWTLLAI